MHARYLPVEVGPNAMGLPDGLARFDAIRIADHLRELLRRDAMFRQMLFVFTVSDKEVEGHARLSCCI